MLAMKFLAVVFAVLVLTKVIMLAVARDYWLGLVDKMFGPGNQAAAIYGGAAAVVGVIVLTQVDIVIVGAVMLWMALLMGLGMVPFSELMLKWRDEIVTVGLTRVWWVMLIWAGLAIWILWAVFWG